MIGKHLSRPHAIQDYIKNDVKKHISNFPVVKSHYITQDSKRKYLEAGLSVSKMYRLYTE